VRKEPEPVRFWVPEMFAAPMVTRMCAHFDTEASFWSGDKGCYPDFARSNSTHTLCQCNHLTSFASLNALVVTSQVWAGCMHLHGTPNRGRLPHALCLPTERLAFFFSELS
jgi:hypothetical protein